MIDAVAKFPAPSTLRWVERAVGGARVVGGRRLIGGITSSVHRLTVADRSGTRRHVVLRRWVGHELDRGRRRVEREARVLAALAGTEIPAPELVGTSDGAETDGIPAILMTRVPGHVHLTPRDPDSWLRQAAAILPRVHDLVIEVDRFEPTPVDPRPAPEWIRPTVWNAAQAVLTQPPPTPAESPRCFIHTDYQHFNMLWQRERLTAIVDWVSPGVGPPDIDVAHCRLNLAVLFSPDWAERFRLAYEAEAGRAVHPWFDLFRLTMFSSDWQQFIPVQVGGRTAVDIAGIPGRVEDVIVATLHRA